MARNWQVSVVLNDAERQVLAEAALVHGLSIATFLRSAALSKCREEGRWPPPEPTD